MVKCACGDPACAQKLSFERSSLWLRDVNTNTSDHLVYLDANALMQLILEAKQALLSLCETKE